MAEITGFNHFPRAALALPIIADQIVKKTALDLERVAKEIVQEKHIWDTGFLINSIYTVTSTDTSYNEARAASSARPNADMANFEPPVPTQEPMTARVVVGASYGIYQELGTIHQPARPFLVPAAETVRPAFESAWLQLEAKLRERGV